MKYFSELELEGRGAHVSMVSVVNDVTERLTALVWVDRIRRYLFQLHQTRNEGYHMSA